MDYTTSKTISVARQIMSRETLQQEDAITEATKGKKLLFKDLPVGAKFRWKSNRGAGDVLQKDGEDTVKNLTTKGGAKKLNYFGPNDPVKIAESTELDEESTEELEEKTGDKEAYQAFFQKTLKKYGADSPYDLSDADKKKFFNEIEKGWKADDEESKNEAYMGRRGGGMAHLSNIKGVGDVVHTVDTLSGQYGKNRVTAGYEVKKGEGAKVVDLGSFEDVEDAILALRKIPKNWTSRWYILGNQRFTTTKAEYYEESTSETLGESPSTNFILKVLGMKDADLVELAIAIKQDKMSHTYTKEEMKTVLSEIKKRKLTKQVKAGLNEESTSEEKVEESSDELREALGDMGKTKQKGRDLEDYAKKHGGIDKEDMIIVAKMLKKGDERGALKFANTLDTDPRDYILSLIYSDLDESQKSIFDIKPDSNKWAKTTSRKLLRIRGGSNTRTVRVGDPLWVHPFDGDRHVAAVDKNDTGGYFFIAKYEINEDAKLEERTKQKMSKTYKELAEQLAEVAEGAVNEAFEDIAITEDKLDEAFVNPKKIVKMLDGYDKSDLVDFMKAVQNHLATKGYSTKEKNLLAAAEAVRGAVKALKGGSKA